MNIENNKLWYFIAIVTVGIWGLTFISTKTLIMHGLTPQEIFVLRFLMAYVGIWLIAPHKLMADSWKDEFLLLLGGVTGGSLYFLTENTALEYTYATNVSFIVCTTPLLTTLLFLWMDKETHASRALWMGSLLALLGVAFVVYNGNFVLKLSPVGDCLSLSAALLWAFYSLLMKRLFQRYDTNFITRKIFFYGLVTILPAFLLRPWSFPLHGLLHPVVWSNLLFLGVLASLICYAVWNVVLKRMGAVRASNFLYLNPLFTLLGSVVWLDERLTFMALVGVLCIVSGLYVAARR